MAKRSEENTIRALRKRLTQMKAQLNAEKDARHDHIARVRETIDEMGRQMQNLRERYTNLQVQYDDLLWKYEEETGVRDEGVPEQEEVPDEEGSEVGASEDVEEGQG